MKEITFPANLKFITALQCGYVAPEDIDKFISVWHKADTSATVWEFLGLTEEQYLDWLQDGDAALESLAKR